VTDREYLTELAERLLGRGLPNAHVTAVVAELAIFLTAAGAARKRSSARSARSHRLAPDGLAEPDEHVRVWRWRADTFAGGALLNRFGARGWEVVWGRRRGPLRLPPGSGAGPALGVPA
jgi:hypothetical protein